MEQFIILKPLNLITLLFIPVANFTSNITEGYAPLDVQFTNLSTDATDLQ
jgi:PKD repeat protein